MQIDVNLRVNSWSSQIRTNHENSHKKFPEEKMRENSAVVCASLIVTDRNKILEKTDWKATKICNWIC